MLSEIVKLFSIAKSLPFLERYISLIIEKTPLAKIVGLLKNLSGQTSLKDALKNIQSNDDLKQELELALLKAEEEYLRSSMKDKAGARERDLNLRKLKNGKNIRANFMLGVALCGLFGCILILVSFKDLLSAEMIAIISTVCGVLGSCLKEAYSFEFGGLNRKSRSFISYNYYFFFFLILSIINLIWFKFYY